MKIIPLLSLLLLLCVPVSAQTKGGAAPVDSFNYVMGTQTFSPKYQFTTQAPLIETSQAILEMGSNVLKFKMGPDWKQQLAKNAPAAPEIHSLTELAAEPTHRRVLEMPFAHYHIWAYPFSAGWWDKGYTPMDAVKEYREIYDFARHLLKTYNGSGKTFYLGHWEGDWYLHPNYNAAAEPSAVTVRGMIDWLNVRQQAIEDARRDTPHQTVEVYQYTEVNLVQKIFKGGKALSSEVLPEVNVDFVSYSSYDSSIPAQRTELLPKALDYIESKLKPKPQITGKRVWIGEYGFPARDYLPQQQEEYSREVMRIALQWGCPFVLYWEMYNNEVDDKGQRGFWLIDDKGQKQPIYFTHQRFLSWAKRYVSDFKMRRQRAPSADEFRRAAADFLLLPPLKP